jgi:hypothetical protein
MPPANLLLAAYRRQRPGSQLSRPPDGQPARPFTICAMGEGEKEIGGINAAEAAL